MLAAHLRLERYGVERPGLTALQTLRDDSLKLPDRVGTLLVAPDQMPNVVTGVAETASRGHALRPMPSWDRELRRSSWPSEPPSDYTRNHDNLCHNNPALTGRT